MCRTHCYVGVIFRSMFTECIECVCVCVCVCIYIYICVCVCVCVSPDTSREATWVNTTRYCKYSQVLLMMGENIARNM